MPVAEFPGDFSWGYNPAHPFAVEESYGGVTGLKDLVKSAHQAGIAVVLDVVYNHFGPSDIDLWQFDGWSDNAGGGIYFYNDWRAETPWGATRPDYGRPEVRQYLRDNALMWLEEFRMDGLRLDGTMFMRNANGMDGDPGSDIPEVWNFFQELNREINEQYPRKLIIAEDLMDNAAITQPVDEGGAGFASQWWGDFVHPVRAVIIQPEDQQRNMDKLAQVVGFPAEKAFERVIYTESHDEVAIGQLLCDQAKLFRGCLGFYCPWNTDDVSRSRVCRRQVVRRWRPAGLVVNQSPRRDTTNVPRHHPTTA